MYSYFKFWRTSAFHRSFLPDATLPPFNFFKCSSSSESEKLVSIQLRQLLWNQSHKIVLQKGQLALESYSFTTNLSVKKWNEGIPQVCTSFIEQWVKRSHELILLEASELVCYNAKFIYKSQFSTSSKLSESDFYKTPPSAQRAKLESQHSWRRWPSRWWAARGLANCPF